MSTASQKQPHIKSIAEPILVTGATGFIGRCLIARLLRENYQVIAFDLPNATFPPAWRNQLKIATGDIRDPIEVQLAAQNCQTIFHLAAVVTDAGPLALHRAITVEGTRNLMEAASHTPARVILTSSIAAYGKKVQSERLDEDLLWGIPAGVYGAAKQEQERLARDIAARAKIPLVVIRPGNVYGPHSPLWVNGVLAELRRGTPGLIDGGDFDAGLCYVENLVELMLLAAAHPQAAGRTYNAADGFGITWKQYFSDLARLANAPRPKSIPRGVAKILSILLENTWNALGLTGRPPLTYETFNLVGHPTRFPITRAMRELGYAPPISYSQAIAALGTSITENAHHD